MRIAKHAVIILVVLGMAFDSSGCGRVDDGLYHYDYLNGRNGPGPEQVEEMISTCALTPSDVLMIDLQGEHAAPVLKGLTCEQIRAVLPGYRQTYPPEPQSMLDNPAKTSNPPSLTGLKYAAISSSNSSSVGGYGVPSQVFVDFVDNTVLFAQYRYVLIHPYSGTTVPLGSPAAAAFLQLLSAVSKWGDPWVQPAGDKYELYMWQVAIVTADDQLYRWEVLRPQILMGPSITPDPNVKWPAGLEDVYNAFWALTGT